jgi:DNA-binding IscR family transcriptional regulator
MLEIYRAVEPGSLFSLHRQQPNQSCLVGRHIEEVLTDIMEDAEKAMARTLANITLADVAQAVGPCGMPESKAQAEAFDVIL